MAAWVGICLALGCQFVFLNYSVIRLSVDGNNQIRFLAFSKISEMAVSEMAVLLQHTAVPITIRIVQNVEK